MNGTATDPRNRTRGATLTAAGQPLQGYTPEPRTGRRFEVFHAKAEEKRLQVQQPDRQRSVLKQARSRAGGRVVNPVFVDPKSGLRLLATEQLVIALKPGINAKKYFGRSWKHIRPVWGATDQFILTLPRATAEMVFTETSKRSTHPEVAWAEPDFIRQAVKSAVPNDPKFADYQWHLNNTGQNGGTVGADAKLPAAWDLTTGRTNILIAILDDGVQIDHPDLAANIYVNGGEIPGNGVDDDQNGVRDDINGYDFFNDLSDPSPYDPLDDHGTAVAGIVGAVGNNGLGGAGAAYGCRLLPLKIIEGDYRVTDSEMAAALRYAAGINSSGQQIWRGADVINISLSFDTSTAVSTALVDAAVRGRDGLGCSIMVSAGNGASAWQSYEVVIDNPGTYTFRWEYVKDGTIASGDDTVWLDGVSFPDGTIESFQGSGLPAGWSTSPSAPWINVQEAVGGNRALVGWNGPASRSLRAGLIGHGQSTWVQVTKTLQPGVMRFWTWVSSERNADYFRFYVGATEFENFRESGVPILDTAVSYPASHPACFAVGASTDFDFRADYSQYGVSLDFLAPSDGGVATVFTTDRPGLEGYNSALSPEGDDAYDFGGTSASSPLAAGVAGLVLSMNSYLYSGEVRALLRGSCDKIGGVTYDTAGRNFYYGSGRLNAGRAVRTAQPDLVVGIAPASTISDAGGLTTYAVTVRNDGEFWSGPFTLTNELTDGAVFGTSTPATTNRTATRLIFSSFGLDTGEQATYRITVTNQLAGTHWLTASVANVVQDSDPADNIATATNSVFPTPAITISDVTLAEGNLRSTTAVFRVTLSNPSAGLVTVNYSTATNTAQSGKDFAPRKGKLTFQPGQTNQTVGITVVSDTRNEADETFTLNLSAPTRATLARVQGIATIQNDDPLPELLIGDVMVTEGNAGAKSAVFKVTLSAASGRDASVTFGTAPGSAQAGADYVPTNGVLTFAAGKTSQNITVKVPGDALQESNLTFFVNLDSPVNAAFGDDQGIATIVNNDKPPKLYLSDATLTEGDSGETNAVLTVRLTPASGLPVTVYFETTNGMAIGGTDFTVTNGFVAFAPGETNQAITIPVLGETLSESNETFFVRLSVPTNALIADALGQITVLDDDPLPAVGFASTSILTSELSGATTNAEFAVALSAPSGRTITVKYSTFADTARAGADFVAKTGAAVFTPGVTNLLVPIAIRSDVEHEFDELFALKLSTPVNATLGATQAVCTIIGDFVPGGVVSVTHGGYVPVSFFWLKGGMSSDGFQLRFPTTLGKHYQVEWTADLSKPAQWQPLQGANQIVGTGDLLEVSDTEAGSRPQRFYRVRALE